MSLGSPTSEQYDPAVQEGDKHASARKSAASAKPATRAASSVYVPTQAPRKAQKRNPLEKLQDKYASSKKPKTKAEKRAQQEAIEERTFQENAAKHVPSTDKYRRLRFLFWATILLAIACTLYALLLIATQGPAAGRVWFGVGSLLVAFAIYIDSNKVKQAREEDYQRILDEQSGKKKPTAAAHESTDQQG